MRFRSLIRMIVVPPTLMARRKAMYLFMVDHPVLFLSFDLGSATGLRLSHTVQVRSRDLKMPGEWQSYKGTATDAPSLHCQSRLRAGNHPRDEPSTAGP